MDMNPRLEFNAPPSSDLKLNESSAEICVDDGTTQDGTFFMSQWNNSMDMSKGSSQWKARTTNQVSFRPGHEADISTGNSQIKSFDTFGLDNNHIRNNHRH